MDEKLLKIIFQAIDKVNEDLSVEDHVEKSTDVVLMGEGASFDSLSLLTLVVELEKNIETEYNVTISLLEDESLNDDHLLLTVAHLSEYIRKLIDT